MAFGGAIRGTVDCRSRTETLRASLSRGTDIVSARNLSDNRYDARSGPLGAGVQGNLASYNRQDIQYDADGTQAGVDVGDGTVRVMPPYRAGYVVQVGSAYFVSATGFAFVDGAPAELASGTVTAIGDDAFTPMPFFTNSAGRFAILGLGPGRRVPRATAQCRVHVHDPRACQRRGAGADGQSGSGARQGVIDSYAHSIPGRHRRRSAFRRAGEREGLQPTLTQGV